MARNRSNSFEGCASSRMPDLIGKTVWNGKLVLLERIGQGAWSCVYLAKNAKKKSNKLYAVKCIPHDDISESDRENLAREITYHQVLSKQAKHIVKMITYTRELDYGLACIVTEYCKDGNLLDMIMDERYFGQDELIRTVYLQILDGVKSCHDAGIFHRDLKPDNILCKRGGLQIVLADFGFATTATMSTDFHMGSLPFMCPEVRGGLHHLVDNYSPEKADIWALGVILLNLVCQKQPWNKASRSDAHFFRFLRDVNFLTDNFPISDELNDILRSIFTPDPRNRITIPALRERIAKLDSFYHVEFDFCDDTSDDDSFFGVPEDQRMKEPVNVLRFVNIQTVNRVLRTMSESSEPRGPLQITRRIQSGCPRMRLDPSSSTAVTSWTHVDVPSDSAPEINHMENVDNSEAESDEPLTPEQVAADAGAAVVDLEDVNDLAGLSIGVGEAVAQVPVKHAVTKAEIQPTDPLPVMIEQRPVACS